MAAVSLALLHCLTRTLRASDERASIKIAFAKGGAAKALYLDQLGWLSDDFSCRTCPNTHADGDCQDSVQFPNCKNVAIAIDVLKKSTEATHLQSVSDVLSSKLSRLNLHLAFMGLDCFQLNFF